MPEETTEQDTIVVTSTTDAKEEPQSEESTQDQEQETAQENEENEQSESAQDTDDQEADETDDDSEASEDEETEDEDSQDDDQKSDKSKRANGAKRRINKLTREKYDAQRDAEFWKKEAMKFREGQNDQTTQDDEAKPKRQSQTQDQDLDKPQKPSADDFENYEDYEDAREGYYEELSEWKVGKALKKREQDEQDKQLKREQAERQQSTQQKISEYVKDPDEWNEMLEDIKHIPFTPALQEAVDISDTPGPLLEALCEDVEFTEKVSGMTHTQACIALGRFEAGLSKSSEESKSSKEKTKNQKTRTRAPKPVSTVKTGTAGAKKSIYDEDLTQAEFEKLMDERRSS